MSLRLSDKEEIDASHMLADVTRTATLNLELSKTNNSRYEAARRQLRAVQEAFVADTVDADQVLEAQRRFLDAYLTYVRVTAELAPDPAVRKLIITKASLAAISHELNHAREIWGRVHQAATPGSKEAANEAQVREQYYQLKSQATKLLDEYHRAKQASACAARTASRCARSWPLPRPCTRKPPLP